MLSVGRCPYCKKAGKERNEHHPIPTRFTGDKRAEEDDKWWTMRLNILFPECFERGINKKKESICFGCHRKVDALIPKEPLLPGKYLRLNNMLKNGTSIDDTGTINDILKAWVEESSSEVERRREEFYLRTVTTVNMVRICLVHILSSI